MTGCKHRERSQGGAGDLLKGTRREKDEARKVQRDGACMKTPSHCKSNMLIMREGAGRGRGSRRDRGGVGKAGWFGGLVAWTW